MNRLSATLAVTTLALGGGIVTAVSSGPAAAVPAAIRGSSFGSSYTPPAIHWGSCTDSTLKAAKAQCGMLVVPMNYADPSGTKIKIAVSRVRHTVSAAKYQGVMLVNPGGPGDSGLDLSTLGSAVPDHAGDAFDWIGFDPRGVGSSVPSLTCDRTYFKGDRPPYTPTTTKILKEWVARSKRYAADCASAKHSELFRYVRTIDTVADMESIRKALGVKQINYYGFSYGTYLGQVYATLHPTRVRRMVLDSNVDPRQVWYTSNLAQDVAFQRTFNIYFGWLAKYHKVFGLGSTQAAVRRLFLATQAKLNKHAAKGVLGGDEFLDDLTDAGYYVYDWVSIGKAFADLVHKNDPDPLISMYTEANPTTAGGDNGFAMYLGTQCSDAFWTRSQVKVDRDSRRYNRKYDYMTWDNAWYNDPCTYWKFPHSTPVKVADHGLKVHILLIDETYDPATPYEGSLYIRRIFPTSSLIEGLDGTTHAGSLSGVACTDDTIAHYLLTGAVPKRRSGNRSDKVCPPVPKPVPTAGSSASSADASSGGVSGAAPAVPPALRAELIGRP